MEEYDEKALDETLATAKRVIEESNKLKETADAIAHEAAQWRDENGVTPEIVETFFDKLTPESKELVEKEEEEFAREMEHDIEEALHKAELDQKGATSVKPRNRKFV